MSQSKTVEYTQVDVPTAPILIHMTDAAPSGEAATPSFQTNPLGSPPSINTICMLNFYLFGLAALCCFLKIAY